jgi:hypothetical protein
MYNPRSSGGGHAARRRAAGEAAARGQSLVEMAIITPLLLLMFLGLVEVGWALRGYLVLVNANREAARFAARGNYLDFGQLDVQDVGYQAVVSHTLDSVAGQLPLEFTGGQPNATMIITHIEIDTGYPCSEAEQPCDDECAANPGRTYPADDRIVLPPPAGAAYGDPAVAISDTFRVQYGVGGAPYATRIADDLWQSLRAQNETLNCQLMSKDPDAPPSVNSVIVVEMFYDQPQLLGVPLIANRFTDPVPLYSHTMMRIAEVRKRATEGSAP